jgi:hypothetical protein
MATTVDLISANAGRREYRVLKWSAPHERYAHFTRFISIIAKDRLFRTIYITEKIVTMYSSMTRESISYLDLIE